MMQIKDSFLHIIINAHASPNIIMLMKILFLRNHLLYWGKFNMLVA